MRRLARHTFTACAALSLVLFLATAVLWVRSHWRGDLAVLSINRGTTALCVGTDTRGLFIEHNQRTMILENVYVSDLSEPPELNRQRGFEVRPSGEGDGR